MKKLYLLRHAKASYPNGVEDKDRPLNERGVAACKQMNAYFKEHNIKPDMVLCSDSRRTTDTAKFVLQGIDTKISYTKKLYLATPGEILKELVGINSEISSVLVIGHNPSIQQMVIILTGVGDINTLAQIKNKYPTCALTEFVFNINQWDNIEPGNGELLRFIKL